LAGWGYDFGRTNSHSRVFHGSDQGGKRIPGDPDVGIHHTKKGRPAGLECGVVVGSVAPGLGVGPNFHFPRKLFSACFRYVLGKQNLRHLRAPEQILDKTGNHFTMPVADERDCYSHRTLTEAFRKPPGAIF